MIDLQQPVTKESAIKLLVGILGICIVVAIGFYVIRGIFRSNSVSPNGEPPVIGEIKSIVDSQILISGPMGEHAVRLSSGTRYENGSFSDLSQGVIVMVVGEEQNGIQHADKIVVNPGNREE